MSIILDDAIEILIQNVDVFPVEYLTNPPFIFKVEFISSINYCSCTGILAISGTGSYLTLNIRKGNVFFILIILLFSRSVLFHFHSQDLLHILKLL